MITQGSSITEGQREGPLGNSGGPCRRSVLKSMVAFPFCAGGMVTARAQTARPQSGLNATIVGYLEGLARPDHGYAWNLRGSSHLSPSFAAIGCFRLLRETPPLKRELAEFVRTHHPFHLKSLERELKVYDFQQIQALTWLGEDTSSFQERVKRWTHPSSYPKQYEKHGHPVFRNELMAYLCRDLLGLPPDDLAPSFVTYLTDRRRRNGSFNNTPTSEGGDGHVMNTWWGLQVMDLLGRGGEAPKETVDWLQACQTPSGGFTWQPSPSFSGVENVAYTWAAVLALKRLDATPLNREKCVESLRSLANRDGGFGDRPGWGSTPMATYYALEALETLDALDSISLPKPTRRPTSPLRSDLKVFTIQLESHGTGSPEEAVTLAESLQIHLWGAKNAKPSWIARAQAIADRRRVPVTFFVANEEYGTWVDVPGLGTYSHTSDIMAPAGARIGEPLSDGRVVSWDPEFRRRRLDPLQQGKGRLFWQFGENEELTRLFLDDSLERGGFAAISTFHFGNPDFANSEAFLNHYRGQIPFVALQDAHGQEPWWFADMTTGFRTLFLARSPTWEGWLEALKHQWVAAVRHDAVSGQATWMHTGSDQVADFIQANQQSWRWWNHQSIHRPLVSLVLLDPTDDFEVGRPEQGYALRVRCAWENTTQGQPKKPITELVELLVDGTTVSPTLVSQKRPNGVGLRDQYHHHLLPDIRPGKHSATAIVRRVGTHEESSRRIDFVIS